jgi:hypothetical protein
MRYTMATLANFTSGGLAATKTATGHKDERMAFKYGGLNSLDESKRVLEHVEHYLEDE